MAQAANFFVTTAGTQVENQPSPWVIESQARLKALLKGFIIDELLAAWELCSYVTVCRGVLQEYLHRYTEYSLYKIATQKPPKDDINMVMLVSSDGQQYEAHQTAASLLEPISAFLSDNMVAKSNENENPEIHLSSINGKTLARLMDIIKAVVPLCKEYPRCSDPTSLTQEDIASIGSVSEKIAQKLTLFWHPLPWEEKINLLAAAHYLKVEPVDEMLLKMAAQEKVPEINNRLSEYIDGNGKATQKWHALLQSIQHPQWKQALVDQYYLTYNETIPYGLVVSETTTPTENAS